MEDTQDKPNTELQNTKIQNTVELTETEDRKSKVKPLTFDYKDPATLYNFITEGGKILPARITGLSHSQQQSLKNSIKKSRRLNLLPVGTKAYDSFPRPEPFSRKPFKFS